LTVVNGGTGLATTIADFAAMMAAALHQAKRIMFSGESKPGDPLHMRADTTHLNALGFVPRVSLRDGLEAYAAWIDAVSTGQKA
jgi:UDP-glucose 4-epimerase